MAAQAASLATSMINRMQLSASALGLNWPQAGLATRAVRASERTDSRPATHTPSMASACNTHDTAVYFRASIRR